MENASKALLIAGAVLIVILIIGVGMAIFSSAKGNVDSAMTSMTSDQIQQFNSKFEAYEGTQKGSQVRSLLNAVATNNKSYDNDDTAEGYIMIGEGAAGTFTTADLSTARQAIHQNNNYEVTISYDAETGLVSEIVYQVK